MTLKQLPEKKYYADLLLLNDLPRWVHEMILSIQNDGLAISDASDIYKVLLLLLKAPDPIFNERVIEKHKESFELLV